MGKYKDTRTPVSVTQVGRWKVTIYDQAAYDASLIEYPGDDKLQRKSIDRNDPVKIEKGKTTSRYNWIYKLDKPLMGTVVNKKG